MAPIPTGVDHKQEVKFKCSRRSKMTIVGEEVCILFTIFHLRANDGWIILTTDEPMEVESSIDYKTYYRKLSYNGHTITIEYLGTIGGLTIHCGSTHHPKYELTPTDLDRITKDEVSLFISDILAKCFKDPTPFLLHKGGLFGLKKPVGGEDEVDATLRFIAEDLNDDLHVELMGGITCLTPDDIKEMSRGIKTIKEDIMER